MCCLCLLRIHKQSHVLFVFFMDPYESSSYVLLIFLMDPLKTLSMCSLYFLWIPRKFFSCVICVFMDPYFFLGCHLCFLWIHKQLYSCATIDNVVSCAICDFYGYIEFFSHVLVVFFMDA